MARIKRDEIAFFGKPITRDQKKRQGQHEWFERVFNNPTLPRRPTFDDLTEEAKAWDNNPMGDWPDA